MAGLSRFIPTAFRCTGWQRKIQGSSGITQFGRALFELRHRDFSRQFPTGQRPGRTGKPRAPRRTVTELRLAGISDMAASNRFLDGFTSPYDADYHHLQPTICIVLNIDVHRLRDVLCKRLNSVISTATRFFLQRQRVILEANQWLPWVSSANLTSVCRPTSQRAAKSR